jgi:hypothetical protein
MILNIVSILCYRGCDYEEYDLQDFNICSASLVYPSTLKTEVIHSSETSCCLRTTCQYNLRGLLFPLLSFHTLNYKKKKKNLVAYYKLTEHVLFNLTP